MNLQTEKQLRQKAEAALKEASRTPGFHELHNALQLHKINNQLISRILQMEVLGTKQLRNLQAATLGLLAQLRVHQSMV